MIKRIVKRDDGSNREILDFSDEKVKTKQSYKNETNINKIMDRYQKTGILGNPLNVKVPLYGDFSKMPTYRESLDMVNNIQKEFLKLPANVRSKFNNDPQNMLDFMSVKENLVECVNLGLYPKSVLPKEEVVVKDRTEAKPQ